MPIAWNDLLCEPLTDEERQQLAEYRRQRYPHHGASPRQKSALAESQGGMCPICLQALPEDRRTHLDHSHETGRLRGVLHGGCNLLVGLVERRPGCLERIARYLESA